MKVHRDTVAVRGGPNNLLKSLGMVRGVRLRVMLRPKKSMFQYYSKQPDLMRRTSKIEGKLANNDGHVQLYTANRIVRTLLTVFVRHTPLVRNLFAPWTGVHIRSTLDRERHHHSIWIT